jgi:hypothetical protein
MRWALSGNNQLPETVMNCQDGNATPVSRTSNANWPKGPEPSASAPPQPTAPTVHALIESVRGWLHSLLDLIVLEGRMAGTGLALILGLVVGATLLLVTAWLALVGCVVVALVENTVLGFTWSLLLVALLNFAGAGGLLFLASQRSQHGLFSVTRRQLSLKSVATPDHE